MRRQDEASKTIICPNLLCAKRPTGGDLMGIFSRRILITADQYAEVSIKLTNEFSILREEFLSAHKLQFTSLNIDTSSFPKEIQGSKYDNALRGFQLTTTIGIVWRHIQDIKGMVAFRNHFKNDIGSTNGSEVEKYNLLFQSCSGNMECLCKFFAKETITALGVNDPNEQVYELFETTANLLIGLSQSAAYAACGNVKMVKKLYGMIEKNFVSENFTEQL